MSNTTARNVEFDASGVETKALAGFPTASTPGHPRDPFSAAGDVVWYLRPPTGGQYGPATAKVMCQWLAEGRISEDTLIWHEGWRDWQKASAFIPQLQMNDPLEEIAQADTAFNQPISTLIRHKSHPRNNKNAPLMVMVLLILVMIVIVSIIFWAANRGSASTVDDAYTPSTRLEARDTLCAARIL